MESQGRSSIPDSFSISRKTPTPCRISVRTFGIYVDEADGFLRCAAAGARDAGDGDSDIGPQAVARGACHRRSGLLRHRAEGEQGLVRHAQSRALELVRISDHPADVHVAGSGNVSQSRAHEAPGTGLRGRESQACSPGVLENHLRHIALVVDRKEVGAESTLQRALDPLGCGCGALGNDEIDDDLQIAGAHGDLHTALLVSGVGENARDRRLARAEQAKQSSLRWTGGHEEPPHRLVLHDASPEPAELTRRPGKRDRYPPVMLEEDGGRRAGETQGNAAGRKRRLLPNALLEVGVRHAQPVGDRAGDGLDLGL